MYNCRFWGGIYEQNYLESSIFYDIDHFCGTDCFTDRTSLHLYCTAIASRNERNWRCRCSNLSFSAATAPYASYLLHMARRFSHRGYFVDWMAYHEKIVFSNSKETILFILVKTFADSICFLVISHSYRPGWIRLSRPFGEALQLFS